MESARTGLLRCSGVWTPLMVKAVLFAVGLVPVEIWAVWALGNDGMFHPTLGTTGSRVLNVLSVPALAFSILYLAWHVLIGRGRVSMLSGRVRRGEQTLGTPLGFLGWRGRRLELDHTHALDVRVITPMMSARVAPMTFVILTSGGQTLCLRSYGVFDGRSAQRLVEFCSTAGVGVTIDDPSEVLGPVPG